jgi:uncharacterized protein (TIGR01777 family)
MIGSALVPLLEREGFAVTRLVRREPTAADEARWDPEAGTPDLAAIAGATAVVHLAATNIASGRWTAKRKAAIRQTRVAGTATLARAIAAAPEPRPAFVCASAVGYYGFGDEPATEASPRGDGFLGETCEAWEGAADPARGAGARVAHLRIGIVLDPSGGALKEMLLPFKLGIAGRLGSGKQPFPWVSLPDVARAFLFAVRDARVDGPINVVAPTPCDNLHFTKTLGRVLRRPTLIPVPAFALRILFGELGGTVTNGRVIIPERLAGIGFAFDERELEPALRRMLNRPA